MAYVPTAVQSPSEFSTGWAAVSENLAGTRFYHRPDPREANIEMLREKHYSKVALERVGMIPLPNKFTVGELVRHLRKLDDTSSLSSDRDRVDELDLKLAEVRRDKLLRGSDRFRAELDTITERTSLLRRQRDVSEVWSFVCQLDGNTPALAAEALADSFYWERTGWAFAEEELMKTSLASIEKAASLKEIDGFTRRFWPRYARVVQSQDRDLAHRERLLLLLDCWNSPSIDDVYRRKTWLVESLPNTWPQYLEQLQESTRILRQTILAEVNPVRAMEGFAIPEWLGPAAREAFQGWRDSLPP